MRRIVPTRLAVAILIAAAAAVVGLLIATGSAPSANPVFASQAATLAPPVWPAPSATPTVSGQLTTCGLVTGYASDSAHMLLTLNADGSQTQYNLQYQFEASPPPSDLGARFAQHTPQSLRVTGRQAAPDSGTPNAVSLRDWMVTRVDSCP